MQLNSERVTEVYRLLLALPRANHETPARKLPWNGVYVFFQRGETCQLERQTIDRIVRVGTHRIQDRFRKRILQHYGGNKNGSVFRKHLGAALLRRANAVDPRLADWLRQGKSTFAEVEAAVSRVLRDDFIFCCVEVEDQEKRQAIERGLIALLAQYPLGQPSNSWLGKYAASNEIRRSGLWNTQYLRAEPMSLEEFDLLRQLVRSSL